MSPDTQFSCVKPDRTQTWQWQLQAWGGSQSSDQFNDVDWFDKACFPDIGWFGVTFAKAKKIWRQGDIAVFRQHRRRIFSSHTSGVRF